MMERVTQVKYSEQLLEKVEVNNIFLNTCILRLTLDKLKHNSINEKTSSNFKLASIIPNILPISLKGIRF